MNIPFQNTSFLENIDFQTIRKSVAFIKQDNLTVIASIFLLIVCFLGVFGPVIAPYNYDQILYTKGGELLATQPPSIAHPFGTTTRGQDVFSRFLYGARPTLITGLLGGLLIVGIGATIGITAGYVGGWVENVLMRITDFVYSVPLIPFAIVLLALLGFNFYTSIVVIGLILWRGNARVLRSQVLQIKERPFILSAKATGASDTRIIIKHILPNVAPMAILYFSLGVGYAILTQAGLAFIGVANPFTPAWGIMIRNAYNSGVMTEAWWWAIPPGLLISMTVMATFIIGRRFESSSGSRGEAVAEAG